MILGIDIGGTGICAQLFRVGEGDGKLQITPCWKIDPSPETQRGKQNHAQQIAEMIAIAAQEAHRQNTTLKAAGIGSPGRFDSECRIKPRTNFNIAREDKPSEMDGVQLEALYRDALVEIAPNLQHLPMVVENDGTAMLAGMLQFIQDGLCSTVRVNDIAGRSVALMGLGTGIGHAIAKVDESGNYRFVTDGHASKLWLELDPEDAKIYRDAEPILNRNGYKYLWEKRSTDARIFIRAEDVCRSPVVNALIESLTGHTDPTQVGDDHPAFAIAGKYMGRLIAEIRTGRKRDTEPYNGWSAKEKELAEQTTTYLLGGGLGRTRGKVLITHAQEALYHADMKDIALYVIPDENRAAYAAACMALKAI